MPFEDRYSRSLPCAKGGGRAQRGPEYGAANLAGKSTWEHAEALIELARRDFRDELTRAAEQQRIWLPHNRR